MGLPYPNTTVNNNHCVHTCTISTRVSVSLFFLFFFSSFPTCQFYWTVSPSALSVPIRLCCTFPRPHPSLSAAELHTDQLEADGQIAFEVELAAEQATFPSDSRSDGKTTNGGAANTWTSGKVASTTPVLLYQGGAATSDTPTTYYLNKTVVMNKTVLGTCLPCCEEPQPGTQVCCCPPPGCAIPPSCPPPLTPPSPPPPFALSTDTTYKFRVRIYTAASATPSAWSAPASFDTAPSKEEWAAASWIGGGSELRTDLVLPPSPIKRARA